MRIECPHCRTPMDAGFLLDHTYGGILAQQWAAGEPQRSLWHGLKLKKVTRLPVTSYRCPKCGRLESFAR